MFCFVLSLHVDDNIFSCWHQRKSQGTKVTCMQYKTSTNQWDRRNSCKKKYSHYHIECNVSVLYALLPYFTKLCLYCAYGLSPFMGDFEHPTLLSPYTPQFHPVIMPCCMTSHELAMLQGTRELKHKCHFSALSLNGVWL